ncbi:HAMP domain-containing sensor histidine kinase [Streptomyces sp. WI04-05B]|uniref:sensor histidine kinase n=1 Tax=Streptomyces TaxID=1883 RepID=UPI0029A808D3|nr:MULTISPECIES: HAMP domain-containing sensor histidine kinase [unclassified Streptomyces]MDX2546482.1 HAMP domain-containing sensor histidine kinase [Streptomyces sp. WI04-05B]MDX2586157.1 HAMP domain-containing sensor histidine kinase [Streptomyces sp. WI04-05A]
MNSVFSRLAPRTLRGRLSLVALTTAALLMVVLTVAFNTLIRHRLQHQADDELHARAAAVATTIDTSGRTVRVLETVNDRLLDTNVWIYADTRLLEQPPSTTADNPLAHAAGELSQRGGSHCVTVDEPGLARLCGVPVTGGRSTVTVVTALDLSPYRSSAATLLWASLCLDAVMLACTYLLTRLAVGRALRPVGAMTDQATQWSAVTSEDRFAAVRRPAELARLGASLDALLDRIRAVLHREQLLTGELSHELRTPLSRIIAELDWWRDRPRSAADTEATHEVIADAALSMRTICDTLLNDAREGTTSTPGTAEILPAMHRLAARLETPARVTVDVRGEHALRAGAQAALLERIVSPLLANAVRYATSQVTVTARREPAGGVSIDVADDGPGVPPSFAGRLFQPGHRADACDGHGGAGLGLPLARRLARSVGGDVSYDPGHVPGARFTVGLPAG